MASGNGTEANSSAVLSVDGKKVILYVRLTRRAK